jgi:UDP:flavonoid glycosyltransferase YjiC (YdhE family)
MRKDHIAFFAPRTHAHINPTLALGAALVQRGHRVTYATTDDFAPKIASFGAEAIIYSPPDLTRWSSILDRDDISLYDPKQWELTLEFLPVFTMRDAVNTLSKVTHFYDVNRPDIILYDYTAYAGHILAKMWKIPAIQTFPHFAFYNDFHVKNGNWCEPSPTLPLRQKMDLFYSTFWPVEDLNLYFIPPSFQYDVQSFDDRFCFVGPSLDIGPPNSLRQEKPKNPTVIVAASTSTYIDPRYFRTFIQALEGSKWNVVLAVGDAIDPVTLGPLPPNFEVCVSHREILPKASLFVGSGGMTSTLEAIYYGMPTILIPQGMYHADVAHRIEQLGLGRVLKKAEVTAETLSAAIDQVYEDSAIHERVQRMQQDIKEAGGPEKAADIVEQYLNRKRALSGT